MKTISRVYSFIADDLDKFILPGTDCVLKPQSTKPTEQQESKAVRSFKCESKRVGVGRGILGIQQCLLIWIKFVFNETKFYFLKWTHWRTHWSKIRFPKRKTKILLTAIIWLKKSVFKRLIVFLYSFSKLFILKYLKNQMIKRIRHVVQRSTHQLARLSLVIRSKNISSYKMTLWN